MRVIIIHLSKSLLEYDIVQTVVTQLHNAAVRVRVNTFSI